MQTTRRTILHVDLDAFYCAVEAGVNPRLKDIALVVGADPEGGRGRGVVVACSYEARRFGLKSGMPISRAWRLCPTATYMRPNFELYESASEKVMATLRVFTNIFEQTGIDEAFLDITSMVKDLQDARNLALDIKNKVYDSFGLTCSVGIGPNKSVAKIASDHMKPNGLTIVPADKAKEFLAPLSVAVIPGVGKKTQLFLKNRGIETIAQLQALQGRQFLRWFGKTGVWLWGVAHAQENIPVRPRDMPKSLSVERTFREDLDDYSKVYAEAQDAAKELMARVREGAFEFRVVGVKIRLSRFQTYTREKSLPSLTDSSTALVENTRLLLQEFESMHEPVRLIGVRVSQLRRRLSESTTLDEWNR